MAKAHVYKRDHINTDEIIPARFLNTDDEQELAKHCLEDLDANFVKKVKPGDVIVVVGDDFGCGSSREHAVWALRGAKVSAVVAGSFARIFYRNAINCGFPLVELPNAGKDINDGDDITIDLTGGILTNKTQGKTLSFTPMPDFAMEIIREGGLLNHIAKKK
ncbi:MAG: 3-isopropylmalate dehydratase small subunit [Sedimentisphaerales bacterium]|nr:3-isopropylmalate dehydratase small subunit [Sedimentisphaerales bacterium]